MIKLIRASLFISIIALIAAMFIPFDLPYKSSFPIDQPPAGPMLVALCGLLATILIPVATYGLLRCRRWANKAAMFAAAPLVVLSLIATLSDEAGKVLTAPIKAAVIVATLSWLLATCLSCISAVSPGRAQRNPGP